MRQYTIKEIQDSLPDILKEVATMVPMAEAPRQPIRFGLLAGKGKIPDDFDTMGQDEILDMFGIKP